jgi:hypothetical protein
MTEIVLATRQPRPIAAIGWIGVAVVLYLAAAWSMLFTRSDWSWGAFRFFGSTDQLSYFAFSTNVANGHSGNVEPFTETGTVSYPRYYYLALGAIARILHASPAVVWTISGLFVQVILVVAIGVTCILFTRRSWTGVLAIVPFIVGTMSIVTGNTWYTPMQSHAVLWGPFAVLFPLNGEAFGLCVGAECLLLLLLAALRIRSARARIVISLVASAIIGFLANFQTYSFLSVVYVTAYVVAAYGLVTFRRRWLIVVSLALVPVLFFIGHHLPFHGNQLVTLLLGLLPAAPGLISLVTRSRWLIVVCVAIAGITASPSVIGVLVAIHDHDPFLLYRVASSVGLGVTWWTGLVGSLVVSVPLVLLFIVGVRRRRPIWVAYPIGAFTAWLLLSSNDLWGANQEPYRLWIDVFTIVVVSSLPLVVSAIQELLRPGDRIVDAPLPLSGPMIPWRAAEPAGRRESLVYRVAVVVVCALVAISAIDWGVFYSTQHQTALIQLQGSRQTAIREAADAAGGGLILPDTCIDPEIVKAVSGRPIAYINTGMAWSNHYLAVETLNATRPAGTLDLRAAHTAGVAWVLTESTCSANWPHKYSSHLKIDKTFTYGSGSIVLWRVSY